MGTKTSNDRHIYKPDQNYEKVQNFRRFPKNHDDSQIIRNQRSKSNLLSQEGLLGQEPVRISLPILAQPQSYIGFQAVKKPEKNNVKKNLPNKNLARLVL